MSRRFWFTADLHLEHEAIISYCNRVQFVEPGTENLFTWVERDGRAPEKVFMFPDVKRMNRVLIENWNARVAQDDCVFLLGDVCLKSKGRMLEVLAEHGPLNGYIVLVKGNHDRNTNGFYRSLGWEVHQGPLRVGDLTLSHRPPEFPNVKAHQTYLCGHVHEQWTHKTYRVSPGAVIYNVGVDVRGFRPCSLAELGLSDDMLGPKTPGGCTCLKNDPCQSCRSAGAEAFARRMRELP